jgi:hypothetical protein
MCNCANGFNSGRSQQQPVVVSQPAARLRPAGVSINRTTAMRQPVGVRNNAPFMGRPKVFNNNHIS